MEQTYSVYIVTNQRNTVLYTGITRDIYRRMLEHKEKKAKGFASKYNVDKLIYHEEFETPMDAITAEKKIKGWTRAKKIILIEEKNPKWADLLELERDSSLRSE